MKKIDIGSGKAKKDGYITLDNDPSVGADICADILSKDLSSCLEKQGIKMGEIDEIRAFHLLEHIEAKYRVEVMRIFFEMLKEGGILHIEVPIAGTAQFWQDPTHLSGWTNRTFWYFTKGNKFGEAFAKRNKDARLFEKVEDETRSEWAYRIMLKKPAL